MLRLVLSLKRLCLLGPFLDASCKKSEKKAGSKAGKQAGTKRRPSLSFLCPNTWHELSSDLAYLVQSHVDIMSAGAFLGFDWALKRLCLLGSFLVASHRKAGNKAGKKE